MTEQELQAIRNMAKQTIGDGWVAVALLLAELETVTAQRDAALRQIEGMKYPSIIVTALSTTPLCHHEFVTETRPHEYTTAGVPTQQRCRKCGLTIHGLAEGV